MSISFSAVANSGPGVGRDDGALRVDGPDLVCPRGWFDDPGEVGPQVGWRAAGHSGKGVAIAGVRLAAGHPSVDGLRVDTEPCGNIDPGQSSAAKGSGKCVVRGSG